MQRNHQEFSQEIGNVNGSCFALQDKQDMEASGDPWQKRETKLACILEATESTRRRVGESLLNHHEDHIAGKGDKSLQQAMKIPAANAAVEKEWEKLEKIPAWDLTKVRRKIRGDR